MSLADLSESTQNYLKIIWSITEHSSEPASTSVIASRAGVRQSSVSDAIKRLRQAGLVQHQPYGAIELTEEGHRYALSMIRRHRLIETFLVETLGYSWDQVHDEAEVLEHAVSDTLIERLDQFLGHPSRDPHGDPIPSASGEMTHPPMAPLSHYAGSQEYRQELPLTLKVERVSDANAQTLRACTHQGVIPGTLLTLRETNTGGQLTVHNGQGLPLRLSPAETEAIFVSLPAS
ncbi:metal-dependent transcriptional regulator [Rothia sp. CCM 9417]|uniref:metal-dependent transcriptional regulator n=1 Tax=unclassified Rothia (in: high G+C Gram-positive bacteria) TaxID=2689056 RepID=UPI003AC29446